MAGVGEKKRARKVKEILREKLEKMFAWVGTYYSEGPRPAISGEEKEATFSTVNITYDKKKKRLVDKYVKVYDKSLLKKPYTEEDVVKDLMRELERTVKKIIPRT